MPDPNANQTPQNPWQVVSTAPAPQATANATASPAAQPSNTQTSDPWKVVSTSPAGQSQGVVSRTLSGIGQSLEDNIVAPLKAVGAPPQDVNEVVAHASGGQGGLVAYRAGKMMTDAFEKMKAAPREHYEQAKQDFIRMAEEFHKSDYRNAATSALSMAEDVSGSVPFVTPTPRSVPGSDIPNRERDIIEGTRQGGDLAGPLARTATDTALVLGAEKLPSAVKKVGQTAEKVAPESMNTLLRANKQANYLYGKNPGQAFIDEGIKIPKTEFTMGGQLENLHGQLETAGDQISSEIKSVLNDPTVAAKKLDIVPNVKNAISDAKKFVSQQTGLEVPKYIDALNELEDSVLTRYDSQGNEIGKVTGTKLSPAEVADVKKSIGKNTQWKVLPTDPDLKLKTYINSVRKKIYGQLADTVEASAPKSNIGELNGRFANIIEAQGLLERRIALEHGTGGMNAALRKGEFWGGLGTLLFSPEPISKTIGGAAVADRVMRSVPGKMATAKTLGAAGDALQSPAAQDISQAAARGVQGSVAVNEGTGADDLVQVHMQDGSVHGVKPEQVDKLLQQNPGARVISGQTQ